MIEKQFYSQFLKILIFEFEFAIRRFWLKEREGPNLSILVLNINMTFCKMMHVHDSLEVVFSSQSSQFYVI